MRESKYITIPVKFIPRFIHDNNKRELATEVLSYGVNFYADQIGHEIEDVINHLIYNNYKNNLPTEIEGRLEDHELEHFGQYDDYRGFIDNGKMMGADADNYEYNELAELLEVDQYLRTLCIQFFKISRALNKLGLINANIEQMMSDYHQLEKHKGEPHTTINITQLFEFRDEKKSDKHRLQYAMYLAIRSILGKKGYHNGVTYKLIFARLFGYRSATDIKTSHITRIKALKEIYDKYYPKDEISASGCPNRNRRRKLLKETCMSWNVHFYSDGIRGMDMSIEGKNGKDLQQLAFDAEKRKQGNKIKRQKEAQAEAKRKALEMLKGSY
jgi:hypothetical protein